jgi:lysophospholipase L1-like esterase
MSARDDSLMNRFDEQGLRRFTARQAIAAVLLASLLLVLLGGESIRRAGEEMNPGVERSLVLVAGKPAGWVADRLPLDEAFADATAGLSPDKNVSKAGGFVAARTDGRRSVPPVTAAAFDPADLGAKAPPRQPLHKLVVTGDSLSTPLDTLLAQRLASRNVKVVRDPHLGTGISKSFTLDWGKLAVGQVRRERPDAVVVFIGANEGFPLPGPDGHDVECCGGEWAAAYANRARQMIDTYRQGGRARVYWLTVPTPRDPDRQRISRAVNAAIAVAAAPWRAQVRVVDTVPIFTPHGYRDAMEVAGVRKIVREADGIHLNETGSGLLAGDLLTLLGRDYVFSG